MANLIKFLRGTQSSLDALIQNGKATEGAFYLTSDTNRLYIGKTISGEGDSAIIRPVSVNQGIVTVSTLAELPTPSKSVAGEFYYVEKDKAGEEGKTLNVLCVCNGSKWVQVNPTYDDTEIQAAIEEINEGIGTINGAIDTINENLTKKADLAGAAFTGTVTLTLGETVANNEAVTKKYVDDYVTDAVANADVTVGVKFEELEEELSTVSNAAKATADLVGTLDNTKGTTIVGYIDTVKDIADEAARVAGLAATQEAFDDHVEAYGEFVETTTDALGTINGALDTFATKANATLTGTATLNNKNIATEEYADGVAETTANAAKEAILGTATTYTDLGKVETKIGQLAEADAGFSNSIDALTTRVSNLENVTDFVGVTSTVLVDQATTSPIKIGEVDYTPKDGDVVISDGDEFVWSNGKWHKFGAANATNVMIETIENRLDAIDGETGHIARINEALGDLEEVDAGFKQRLDALDGANGAIARIDGEIAEHKEAYEAYKIEAKGVTDKIAEDLGKAVEDLGKEDDTLAEAIATEKAAREQLAKDLEWGSF